MIQITFSDFTEGTYDSIEIAEKEILENFSEGVLPEQIIELDVDGNETDTVYACDWSVKLTKQG